MDPKDAAVAAVTSNTDPVGNAEAVPVDDPNPSDGGNPPKVQDETVTITKKERDELHAKIRRETKKAAELEAQIEAERQKKLQEEGDWKAIAEDSSKKLTDAQSELLNLKRQLVIGSIAERYNFHDQSVLMSLLPADIGSDPADLERAIAKLAIDKPYLVKASLTNTGGATHGQPRKLEATSSEPYADMSKEQIKAAIRAEQNKT